MLTQSKLFVLILALSAVTFMTPPAYAAGDSEADRLVSGFPTLDELEKHLGGESLPTAENARPSSFHESSGPSEGSVIPVSARWFTAPRTSDSFSPSAAEPRIESQEKPLAILLADMDAEQAKTTTLNNEIVRQNNLPVNKYLLDRVGAVARTDYGTNITGLFVNGIGFGSFQQTLRQNYGASYTLPLLQRYANSTKWTRLLGGWSISSLAGVTPSLSRMFQLQQLLNNLQFTWSFSFSYTLNGSTLRKIQDGQLEQEADLGKATIRAAEAREELLKRMALRIDALSASGPARDSRLTSLRELYPQFEMYQARYQQATACDERMEDFFTLKGLALSLLTLAGYDRPENAASNLLQTWKRARPTGCGSAS